MEIITRWICGEFMEVTIKSGNATIEYSAYDDASRRELAESFRVAAEELMRGLEQP